MSKRRRRAQKPKPYRGRAPVPPPGQRFKDRKKEASKKAARGRVTEE